MFSQIMRWGGVLVLGGFMILGPGILQAREKGEDKPRFQGSDDHQFAGELRSVGALKFYEETEDLLRSGKFELAFSRYVFLNSHIRDQPIYVGLAAMVNQRLNFLKAQMNLGETTPHFVHIEPEKRKARTRRAPPCPPAAKKTDKQAAPDSEEKPPEIVIPPTVTDDKEKAPPSDEKKPPEKAAQEPAPAPGIWEKLKSKLKFW